MLVRWVSRGLVLGLTLTVAGCKCSSGASVSASAAPVGSVTPLNELAASVASSAQVARKTVADLVAPPLTPPGDAQSGAGGLRYKIVKLGVGEPVNPNDGIRAEYSVWTSTGTLVYSTYRFHGPAGATAAFVPQEFSALVGQLPAGSKAWIWVPAPVVHAVLQQRMNLPFPDAALVIEYEPLEIEHRVGPELASPSGSVAPAPPRTASSFPQPDAAGAPKDALVSTSGLHYVVLVPGTGAQKPQPADKLILKLTLWPVTGLVVGSPSLSQTPSATTLARAPAGLASVLQTLTTGSVVRVWLPAGKAEQVGPVPAGHEAVLDLSLERLE